MTRTGRHPGSGVTTIRPRPLGSLPLGDVADDALPASISKDLRTHFDRHIRSVSAPKRPFRRVRGPADDIVAREIEQPTAGGIHLR
jgi:hypothetical protein